MSRLDVIMDERSKRERESTCLAVYGGLEKAVERGGGQLRRISVSFDATGCLLVLKAEFPAGTMIGFVGGEDMAQVLRKGTTEAGADKIQWREDKWRDNGG